VSQGNLPVRYRLRAARLDHAPIIATTQSQSVGQCSAILYSVLYKGAATEEWPAGWVGD
jgi:hypothetical protein